MTPLIAVVGRPNVGKSTLFNRLAGRRLAIVHDAPGVTRDRHYAAAEVHGRECIVIDTGGFEPNSDDPMGQGITRQVMVAVEEADVVICVLDGTLPPTAADANAVEQLRRTSKPVIYVANKVDGPRQEAETAEHYALGLDHLIAVSALHGRGTGELAEAIAAALPAPEATLDATPAGDDAPHRIALVGRPNAGKSSIFNRLSGSERSLVDHRPGTTRDPVDTVVEHAGHRYLLVDTAGIRRKARVERGVEAVSVIRAIKAVERAEVVVLMNDGTESISEQDARLLGLCHDRGRALIVGLNKMDLLDAGDRKLALRKAEEALHFARWVPIVPLSVKTGKGVSQLMTQVREAAREFRRRVTTAELNRFFETVLERHPPPTQGGKAPRIYFITQAESSPPLFIAMSNAPDNIAESYRRFVQNQIREHFGFRYVPIRVRYRKRS